MAGITNLAELNAILAQCGCCEMPRCCPPLLECQSLTGGFFVQGYVKPDSGSDSGGIGEVYLKKGTTSILTGGGTVSGGSASGEDAGDCGYSSSTWSIDARSFYGHAYTRAYQGGIGYDTASSGSGGCPVWPLETPKVFCSASGMSTITHSDTKCWGGEGSDPPTAEYAVSAVDTYTIDEAEGDLNPDWVAWHAEFGEGYAAAKATYEGHLEDVAVYDAWVAAGEIPPAPPLPADPPPDMPVDPPLKFFGPCDFKVTETIDIRPHYFGKNSDGTSAEPVPVGEDPTFAEWIAAGAPAGWGPPCSGVGEIVRYTDTPLASLSVLAQGPVTHTESTDYEDAVTGTEWLAQVAALMAAAEFPNQDCMGSQCSAFRSLSGDLLTQADDLHFTEQIFRYRLKLNKCCGYNTILSGWSEVFLPQAYLDWLLAVDAATSSETPPPCPVDLNDTATLKQWLWSGAPPLCPEDSSSGSSSATLDPYDHEPMWSPWSLTVRVPDLQRGMVILRNYWQKCYGPLPDEMPLVMGALDLSDSV